MSDPVRWFGFTGRTEDLPAAPETRQQAFWDYERHILYGVSEEMQWVRIPDPLTLIHVDAAFGVTKSSDLISALADAGSSPGIFAQLTGANQPLWVAALFGDQPGIRFDGAGDVLRKPLYSGAAYFGTLAFVIRPLDAASTLGILSWEDALGDTTPFLIVQRDGTNVRIYYGGDYQYTIAHPTGEAHSYIFVWNPDAINLYVDGAAQGALSVAGTDSGHSIDLGVGYSGYCNVEIADLRLFSCEYTAAQVSTLSAALAARYSL